MNKNCDITRDLIPLCLDGICSESSKDFINEHISTCLECKQIFEDVKTTDVNIRIDDDITQVVKNTGKKIKKDKKKAVMKAIVIVLAFFLIVGSFVAMRTPISIGKMAYEKGVLENVKNSITLSNKTKAENNFECNMASFYVDSKLGEYTIEEKSEDDFRNCTLDFENGKSITIIKSTETIETYDEYAEKFTGTDKYLISPFVKRGLELYGFDTTISPEANVKLMKFLISQPEVESGVFMSPNNYCKAHAFYSLVNVLVPVSDSYIICEKEGYECVGFIIGDKTTKTGHVINIQSNANYSLYTLYAKGLTNEEVGIIFNSLELK